MRLLVLGTNNERQTIDNSNNHPVPRTSLRWLITVIMMMIPAGMPVMFRIGSGSQECLRSPEEPPHLLLHGVGMVPGGCLLYGGGGVELAAADAGHFVHRFTGGDRTALRARHFVRTASFFVKYWKETREVRSKEGMA